MSKARDYSSRSFTPGTARPQRSQPSSKVDTSGKFKEKQDMVSLNDKFVALIDKVKALENERKKLDTKLKILKKQEDYNGKVDAIVKQLENELKQQVDSLLNDQEKLKEELLKEQEEVEDTRKSYEEELFKKNDLENEFVVTKKSADQGHLDAVALALELEELMRQMEFLRAGYDEELKELESQVQNENVIISDPDKRSLDLEEVVKTIEVQYANMAARTREEAEQWNQKKMDVLVLNAGEREQEVRDIRREIADTLREIQRLNADIDALKRKEDLLRKEIDEAREEGEENLGQASNDIAQLEEALKLTKQELARQIREHQDLLNLKLALDIATYRKLLEGEEQRMNNLQLHADVHLPLKRHSPPEKPRAAERTSVRENGTPPQDINTIQAKFHVPKKQLLIRVEVESGRVVSETSHYTE